jgi:hypothetical protein
MSYVKVNDSSDSDEDSRDNIASSSATPSQPHNNASRIRSIASLASLPSRADTHHYRRVIHEEDEEEEEHDASKQPGQADIASQASNRMQQPDDNDLEIHVRFGEGQDLCLRVPRTFTIAQVKDKVRAKLPLGYRIYWTFQSYHLSKIWNR